MTTSRFLTSLVVVCAAAPACHKNDAPPGDARESTPPAPPPMMESLRFAVRSGAQGFGVPQGCRLLATRRAPLPNGSVRLASAREDPRELGLAIDTDADRRVDRAALVPTDGSTPRPLPWTDLENPPLMVRGPNAWLFVLDGAVDRNGGLRRVWLWREQAKPETLAIGDQLAAWDTACTDRRCALLTSLTDRAKASGASVFLGTADARADRWKKMDVRPPGPDIFRPLSVVEVLSDRAMVALESDHGVELWSVTNTAVSRSASYRSPYGTYDVLASDPPVAVTAGNPPEECKVDRFELGFVDPNAVRETATIPVAPEAIFARRVERGFFLAWVAPISCRNKSRTMVSALLADTKGHPVSSAMAVGDADSFAVTAHGSEVNMWLLRHGELIRLEARCAPGSPAEASPAPSSSR